MPWQRRYCTAVRTMLAVAVLAAGVARPAAAQARPTATRVGDIQVGGQFSTTNSDYSNLRINGAGFYATYDFTQHLGVEVDFHQLNDNSGTKVYERTYEAGGRYMRHYGRLTPYAKALYGRGVLNFQQDQANLAYNMAVGGGGAEFDVKPWLAVRGDFEYQRWFSGLLLPHGITPSVISAGVAYRFGSYSLKNAKLTQ